MKTLTMGIRQTLAVPSYEDEIKYCPEFLSNLTLDTKLVWAGMVYTQHLLRKSQILQVLSSLPVAIWYPFGEISTPKMPFKWPSINMIQRPVRRSQTRPKESIPLENKIVHIYLLNEETDL